MNRGFVGRYNELKELNKRYSVNKKEFGVIYGRRRIGKSALIIEFLKGKQGLIFQAIGGIRTHEMGKFERDRFFDPDRFGGAELVPHLFPFDRQEMDRHVAVERFAVGPAVQMVFVGEFHVDFQVILQFLYLDMTVLERDGVDAAGDH